MLTPLLHALYRKYILFHQLKIRRQLNECPVLLSLPPKLSRMTHMLLCRMFFERFNVAGFTYIERPLASLYAANLTSGVVVEINQDETDYISCYDSLLHHSSSLSIPVGIRDCELHLAHILRSNSSVIQALCPPDNPVDPLQLDQRLLGLARFLWQSGHIKIPIEGEAEKDDDGNLDIAALLVSGKEKTLIEAASNKRKGQTKADKEREKEKAALDLITVQYKDFPPIMIGRERHRFCEPLFEPNVLYHTSIPVQTSISMDGASQPTPPVPKDPDLTMPIHAAVHSVVKSAPFSQRSHIYFGLLITGPLANIHGEPSSPYPAALSHASTGLGAALQSRLSLYLATDRTGSEKPVPAFQPNHVHAAKVPEYFAEFRNKGDLLAAFLGCGIVAKASFLFSAVRFLISDTDDIRRRFGSQFCFKG